MKVVINTCYGGFGLSDAAYERLIALGVPVRAYVKERRGDDGLYKSEPSNEGEIIFDRDMDANDPDELERAVRRLSGSRYWDTWLRNSRADSRLVQVVEELGSEEASGSCARLAVVEIPDGVEYSVEEYDGLEHVAEAHRTWS